MKQLPTTKKLVIPAVFLMAFALGYYLASYQFSLAHMAEEFALDNARIGVLAGATFFAQIFAPPLFGMLADRYSKKPFLFLAAALLAMAMLLFFSARSYGALLVAAMMGGAGFGSLEGLYISVLADVYPEKITRFNNFTQIMFGLGAFSGPFAAYALMQTGWQWRQVFLPVLLMLAAIAALLLLLDTRKATAVPAALGRTEEKSRFSLFRQPLFYLLLVWVMLYVGVETCLGSFADLYIARDLNMPQISAMSLSFFWLMMVPSRLVFGLIKKHHIQLLLVLCALLIAVPVFIAAAGSGYTAFVGIAVSGFLCGPIWPTVVSFNQRAFPQATGTVGSFGSSFSGLGGFLFPALTGLVSEGRPLSTVYYAVGAISVLMLLVGLFTQRLLKKRAVNTD